MSKYRVYGSLAITVWVEVEADSENDAIEVADQKFSGLTGFVGNGGTGKLIGVYDTSQGLFPSEDAPEWLEAEKL